MDYHTDKIVLYPMKIQNFDKNFNLLISIQDSIFYDFKRINLTEYWVNLIVNIILTQFTPNNNKMHALDHQRLSHVHHIIITRPIHKLLLSIHDKLITNWHISHMH